MLLKKEMILHVSMIPLQLLLVPKGPVGGSTQQQVNSVHATVYFMLLMNNILTPDDTVFCTS